MSSYWEIHVTADGKAAKHSGGSWESPVSLADAQAVLQARYDRYGGSQEFQIYLHGGIYSLRECLTLSKGIPCRWQSYPGEKAVITSAMPLTDWKETTVNGCRAWQTYLPGVEKAGLNYRSLLVNGETRNRPRYPKEGFFDMQSVPGLDLNHVVFGMGSDCFIVHENEMKQWENMGDIDVLLPHYWVEERVPLESYDESERKVTMHGVSTYPLADDYVERYCRYALDNVKEALNEEGLWYLDRPTGILTYLPYANETLENTSIILPTMEQGIQWKGASNQRFENIEFTGFDWSVKMIRIDKHYNRTGKLCSGQGGQGATGAPAAILMTDSNNCSFYHCRFHDMGGYALDIGDGCHHITIDHCEFDHLGGGGIRIGDIFKPQTCSTHHILVTDCHIHALGRIFHASIGILATHASYNRFSHNHIHDLFYSAISVGWIWGYAPSLSHHNIIEYNELHDIGKKVLSDMGGIYTLGEQPGTEIRGNVIYDIQRRNYGGWAIYPDEGSAYMVIENNLCYNTESSVFHQHYGKENIIRNNIFAFGEEGIIAFTRPEEHNSYSMYGNIILTKGIPYHVSPGNRMHQKGFLCDNNLYWDYSSKNPEDTFICGNGGETGNLIATLYEKINWQEWQAMGWDNHSIIADPHFANPLAGDFSITDDTNLKRIGFVPFNTDNVGVREE